MLLRAVLNVIESVLSGSDDICQASAKALSLSLSATIFDVSATSSPCRAAQSPRLVTIRSPKTRDMAPEQFHHRSTTKGSNKAFKTRHASKSAVKEKQKGRVDGL